MDEPLSPYHAAVAAWLKAAVVASGLSYREVARRADVDHAMICRMARGTRNFTGTTLAKLQAVPGSPSTPSLPLTALVAENRALRQDLRATCARVRVAREQLAVTLAKLLASQAFYRDLRSAAD